MAKAEIKEVVRNITLELSMEEANTLQSLLVKVGGNPVYSRRRYTNSIMVALDKVSAKATNEDMNNGGMFYFLGEVKNG